MSSRTREKRSIEERNELQQFELGAVWVFEVTPKCVNDAPQS
jgi:hypothetical protein